MTALERFQDVAEQHLCTGCGACAYLAPSQYQMVDSVDGFRRPLPLTVTRAADVDLPACPGASLAHERRLPAAHDASVGTEWGPVLEVWEGWATDEQLRWEGSSGGVVSALAVYGLTTGAAGVLHSRPVPDAPLRSETVLSTSRQEVLAAAGSRYAPASPCDGLGLIEVAGGPCIFIGKPCDVAGASAAAERRPVLRAQLALTMAVFCAGTPSGLGTRDALQRLGVDPDDVAELRYRGHGWPGEFTVTTRNGDSRSLTYADSWGAILQRHRQWRCMICPDHTGEFADLSVGDPWYRSIVPGEPGRSLVVVRTERGRRFLQQAVASGSVHLTQVPAKVLVASQPNLLAVRGAVWGRVTTMRLLRMAVPRYKGMPMLRAWMRMGLTQKLRSTLGTARRMRRRSLRQRQEVVEVET